MQYRSLLSIGSVLVAAFTLTACGGGGGGDGGAAPVNAPPSNVAPTASASADTTSGIAPFTVNFDASSSSDSDGAISTFSWDFGGVASGEGEMIAHEFTSEGTFTVVLTVTDAAGATGTTMLTIMAAANQAPSAQFSASSPSNFEAPTSFSFDATSSSDIDGTVDNYSWDFGDGTSGNGTAVDHVYDDAGVFTVTLTVTDDKGGTDTFSLTLDQVTATTPPTIVSVSPDNATTDVALDAPISITFSEDIDAASFNANNVTVTGTDGPVSGTLAVSGNVGTFTPTGEYPSITRFELSVTSVTDLRGNTLANAMTSLFYTAFDTARGRWYRLTNVFGGPDQALSLNADDRCQMSDINNVNDLWQARRGAAGTYFFENIAAGDRQGLEAGRLDDGCLMTGFPAIGDLFSGQSWRVVPIEGFTDVGYFRLEPGTGGALDHGLRSEIGGFSGQFWRFTPWGLGGVLVGATIGESPDGSPFALECPADDGVYTSRLNSIAVTSGAWVDSLAVDCRLADNTDSFIGSTGGTGGSANDVVSCPDGSVLAGIRGSSVPGSFVGELGVECRFPNKDPEPSGSLEGMNSGGSLVSSTCAAPWQTVGIRGTSDIYINTVRISCHPPLASFAVLDPVGSGSTAPSFSLGCPHGTAAIGLRGRAGDDIDQVRLVCRDEANELSESASVGGSGGSSFGDQQVCSFSEVMVGIKAKARNGAQIDQFSVRCMSQTNGTIFDGGPTAAGLVGVDQSADPLQTLDCPVGMFVSGMTGLAGSLLNQVTLHCSTL